MRNPDSVSVSSCVLHLVGEGEDRDTVLSNSLLDLSTDTATQKFVEKHVTNSLASEHAIAARWMDSASAVCTQCATVFEADSKMLAASKKIATALGLIVREDSRITRAALLIATFSLAGKNAGTGQSHIAILKLDPSEGFVQRKRTVDGKTQIVLTKINNVIPSAKEKLQKCAFICNPKDRETIMPTNCDLLVLDRQHRDDASAADFFFKAFLGAARSTDDLTLTKQFDHAVTRTIAALRSKNLIDDAVRNDLFAQRHAALRGTTLTVNTFLDNMPVSDAAKQVAREQLSVLADQTFTPDEQYAIQTTRKVVFKGAHGLQVTVDSEHLNEVIEEEDHITNDPKYGDHWKVTLRTRSWQRTQAR